MFLDHGHPRFGNFDFLIPDDVTRVESSYVDSFLDSMGVPVRVPMNKLHLIPKQIVTGHADMLRNG